MNGETKNGMQCAEFDALLADALDGTLTGGRLMSFERHKTECATCGAMFAEADAGLKWLETLGEVEPPRNLIHNILVATSGVAETARDTEMSKPPLWDRVRAWVNPHVSPLFTPRFAMSCAMAFFSVSMVMSVTGVRPHDLTPKGVTRAYYDSQARVVKYYENIRLVYEIESRVSDLKRVMDTTGSDAGGGNTNQKQRQKQAPKDEKQNNTNREPEQKQYQNYSRDKDDGVLVALDRRLSDPERQRREI
jgi:putative zinc finger protein